MSGDPTGLVHGDGTGYEWDDDHEERNKHVTTMTCAPTSHLVEGIEGLNLDVDSNVPINSIEDNTEHTPPDLVPHTVNSQFMHTDDFRRLFVEFVTLIL